MRFLRCGVFDALDIFWAIARQALSGAALMRAGRTTGSFLHCYNRYKSTVQDLYESLDKNSLGIADE